MKIEAITVCINHADFLAHTILFNQRQFDRWVVVTSPDDDWTKEVCDFYGIETVLTDVARTKWGEFQKGACINAGLEALTKDAWLVHIDADTALPPKFKETFEMTEPITDCLYGLDRILFDNIEDWLDFVAHPHGFGYPYLGFSLGGRVTGSSTKGYMPIGYFQMWHRDSGIVKHPVCWEGSQEDVVFSGFWPRNKRVLIPELACYHLASESGVALNWKGRKSKLFQINRGEQKCQRP